MNIRTQELYDCLIDQAMGEFSRNGFENTSLNQILDSVKMSKGSFYHHFGGKEAFYLYLVRIVLQKKRVYLIEKDLLNPVEGDIFQMIQQQVEGSLSFAREHPIMEAFIESVILERGTRIYTRLHEVFRLSDSQGLQGMIDLAIQRGELRSDLPVDFVKRVLIFFLSHLVEISESSRLRDYQESSHMMMRFLRSGLGVKET
jgi:AcrR family transcriptional regulator